MRRRDALGRLMRRSMNWVIMISVTPKRVMDGAEDETSVYVLSAVLFEEERKKYGPNDELGLGLGNSG